MKKINQYKRTYHKEKGALLTIMFVLFIWLLIQMQPRDEDIYVREKDVFMKPIVVQPEETIVDKIKRYFPRSHKTMIAVAYAESGMNHEAQNWNCYYNKNETVVYKTRVKGTHSTSCKKEHRKYAWSIDCGIMQLNYIGAKECPNVDIDTHIKQAAKLSKVQGKEAWAAYNNNSYKKYLAKSE